MKYNVGSPFFLRKKYFLFTKESIKGAGGPQEGLLQLNFFSPFLHTADLLGPPFNPSGPPFGPPLAWGPVKD